MNMIKGATKLLALLMILGVIAPSSAIALNGQPQNSSDQKMDPRASREDDSGVAEDNSKLAPTNSGDKKIIYKLNIQHLTEEDVKVINKNAHINHTYDYDHLDELKKYEYLNMGNEANLTNKEKLKKGKKDRTHSLEKSLYKNNRGNSLQPTEPLEFSTRIFGN